MNSNSSIDNFDTINYKYNCHYCLITHVRPTPFVTDWYCESCYRLNKLYPPPPHTRAFATGATRDNDSQKLDYEGFISPLVDRRFAEYMHECRLRNVPEGQSIRSSDNWQKGMPLDSYAKSLVRHVTEFRLLHDGFLAWDDKNNPMNLEDVLCAIRFNVDGYLFELLKEKYARRTAGERVMPKLSQKPSFDPEV